MYNRTAGSSSPTVDPNPRRVSKQRLLPIFRDEDNIAFAFPFRVVQTFTYIHFEARVVEPERFTAAFLKNDSGVVKLRESPRKVGVNSELLNDHVQKRRQSRHNQRKFRLFRSNRRN